jgi:hypothetical protein
MTTPHPLYSTSTRRRLDWQLGYQEALADLALALADGGTFGATEWIRNNTVKVTP